MNNAMYRTAQDYAAARIAEAQRHRAATAARIFSGRRQGKISQ